MGEGVCSEANQLNCHGEILSASAIQNHLFSLALVILILHMQHYPNAQRPPGDHPGFPSLTDEDPPGRQALFTLEPTPGGETEHMGGGYATVAVGARSRLCGAYTELVEA